MSRPSTVSLTIGASVLIALASLTPACGSDPRVRELPGNTEDGGGEDTPTQDGGGSGSGGGTCTTFDAGTPNQSDAGDSFVSSPDAWLLYGVTTTVKDCPGGEETSENITYYAKVVQTNYRDTYEAEMAALRARMQSDFEGAQFLIEANTGNSGRHAVFIRYAYLDTTRSGCRPRMIVFGFGTSYEEALSNAIREKNKRAPTESCEELQHLRW